MVVLGLVNSVGGDFYYYVHILVSRIVLFVIGFLLIGVC